MKIAVLVGIFFHSAVFCYGTTTSNQAKDTIKRVLILGNSITRHGPSSKIGWYGNWGMAASSREKDFVHILETRLQKQHPGTQVDFENISTFETLFWKYDFAKLDSLKALRPDLVILRIGENVSTDSIEKYAFYRYYDSLVNYFMKDNAHVKVYSVSSFWKKDSVDSIMKAAGQRKNGYYVRLSHLSDDQTNMAIGQFAHAGVARHPSDKGMMAIADAIWDAINTSVE